MSLPTELIRTYTDFFGTYDLILDDPGNLKTDNTGLLTCTAIISFPAHKYQTYLEDPALLLGARHPIFSSITALQMEGREVAFKGPRAIARCSYAGIDNASGNSGTPPQYELIIGTTESPIDSHPKFKADIGGTPRAPINGASFRSVDGLLTSREGQVSGTNAGFVFDSFDNTDVEGVQNELAGTTSFVEATMTARKSFKMNRLPTETDTGKVGMLQFPDFTVPTPDGRNWLNMGINVSQQRGGAYFWDKEWRLSGRNGWSTKIYRIAS